MEGDFNYEDVFMGVLQTYKSDYRTKRLAEAVELKKGKLLDIGCGGGILTESLIAYYPHVELYGCDISKTAITYARKLGSGKVKYAVLRKKKFPYKDNFFDVCICLDVMEHVPDVEFFLKEIRRVLKKNGRFFLIVPCEGQPFTYSWLFKKIRLGETMTFRNWGHIHPEFTHKSVKKLLEDKGFKIMEVMYSEHIFWQMVSLVVYFWPKEILGYVFGKKASKYSDSGVVRSEDKKKQKRDALLLARNICLAANSFFRRITYWEIDAFKHVSITGWKMQVLAKNVKNSS